MTVRCVSPVKRSLHSTLCGAPAVARVRYTHAGTRGKWRNVCTLHLAITQKSSNDPSRTDKLEVEKYGAEK